MVKVVMPYLCVSVCVCGRMWESAHVCGGGGGEESSIANSIIISTRTSFGVFNFFKSVARSHQ